MGSGYQPIIGLEIHIELKTTSKMFCQCSADYFGKPPNTLVCPVCLGLPGALPVPNQKAIKWSLLVGKALNCHINKISKFDRKHYFYPDLPKGYQISQYDMPFCQNGYLEIYPSRIGKNDKKINSVKKFRIRRVHLEEDTGKLVHQDKETLIDFNRSGVPLVEIVTEPDFDNSDDVKRFLEELQILLRYLGISDCDMEKGTMRLEPNISLKKLSLSNLQSSIDSSIINDQLPNYKVEIKNINSFRFVKQAIDYEIERQRQLLENGITPVQETKGFDEKKGITYSQRSKEEAHDYRYFPEPDIPPIIFSQKEIDEIKPPLSPFAQLKLLVDNYRIRYEDAFILTRDLSTLTLFIKIIKKMEQILIEKNLSIEALNQKLANLIINKKISYFQNIEDFVNKALSLLLPKKTDKKLLEETVEKILIENPKPVADYQSGKKSALMFLVGQVMKRLKGQVLAKEVIMVLKKFLDKKNK